MASPMEADPQVLIPTTKKGIGLQGNHEGYLKALMGVKDELEAAVKSPGAGQAIQSTMQNAWTKGNALAVSLQGLLDIMMDTANKIDSKDMDNFLQLMRTEGAETGAAALGADGRAMDNPGKISPDWS
ncbi:hypothetical protein [Nocardia mexicana]|uniref:Uncharacterized protein n=1 Tax=Nocardia mexicana TaxID=279262 RepID=A0A370HDN4_9NOCA|nr:hypothetical protein [Nocardia mexicana]RDI54535.1 hypothetical protein DFR68_102663 [Nocardia mexicana]